MQLISGKECERPGVRAQAATHMRKRHEGFFPPTKRNSKGIPEKSGLDHQSLSERSKNIGQRLGIWPLAIGSLTQSAF